MEISLTNRRLAIAHVRSVEIEGNAAKECEGAMYVGISFANNRKFKRVREARR